MIVSMLKGVVEVLDMIELMKKILATLVIVGMYVMAIVITATMQSNVILFWISVGCAVVGFGVLVFLLAIIWSEDFRSDMFM